MAATPVFRFMDLPPELRYRTYDFLGLVHPEPLSIYDISLLPEVVQNAPKILQEEMLDVYIGKNRFIISCLMGLPQLLSTDAKPYIPRIRRLRLAALGTMTEDHFYSSRSRSVFGPDLPDARCEVDVDLVRREPWITTKLTLIRPGDQSCSNKVLASLEAKLDAGLLKSKDNGRIFDTDSLRDLAEHWVQSRVLLQSGLLQ